MAVSLRRTGIKNELLCSFSGFHLADLLQANVTDANSVLPVLIGNITFPSQKPFSLFVFLKTREPFAPKSLRTVRKWPGFNECQI